MSHEKTSRAGGVPVYVVYSPTMIGAVLTDKGVATKMRDLMKTAEPDQVWTMEASTVDSAHSVADLTQRATVGWHGLPRTHHACCMRLTTYGHGPRMVMVAGTGANLNRAIYMLERIGWKFDDGGSTAEHADRSLDSASHLVVARDADRMRGRLVHAVWLVDPTDEQRDAAKSIVLPNGFIQETIGDAEAIVHYDANGAMTTSPPMYIKSNGVGEADAPSTTRSFGADGVKRANLAMKCVIAGCTDDETRARLMFHDGQVRLSDGLGPDTAEGKRLSLLNGAASAKVMLLSIAYGEIQADDARIGLLRETIDRCHCNLGGMPDVARA